MREWIFIVKPAIKMEDPFPKSGHYDNMLPSGRYTPNQPNSNPNSTTTSYSQPFHGIFASYFHIPGKKNEAGQGVSV